MLCLKKIIFYKKLYNLKSHLFCSQNVTTALVDQVVDGHASDVIKMKEAVEEMWRVSETKRARRTMASASAPGFSLFGDNIG